MRFAFVTTEYPVRAITVGGLATHLARMAQLLTAAGHSVEIFLPAGAVPAGVHDRPEARIEAVAVAARGWTMLDPVLLRLEGGGLAAPMRALVRRRRLAEAAAVAAAVEVRHARAPFDVVQAADHLGIGRRLERRPGRLLAVGASSARELYDAGTPAAGSAVAAAELRLESETLARAELAFAPSALTAAHYRDRLGRAVAVIRPPAFLEAAPADPPPDWLPPRYLVHFAGRLIPRKGTDLVAAALARALAEEPGLRMVWVGRAEFAAQEALLAPLGALAQRVLLLYPQPKPVLYAIVARAAAAVLPSRIDNLPNTAIESLLLGTPVIGSDGSSLEELVEPGVTGALVANGSVEALAGAMVAAWRGRLVPPGAPAWLDTARGAPVRPETALADYLDRIAAARAGG
jgi:glycosyltransferase involved in cell wall biosynthesis